jgi:hypothetical protein
MPTSINKLNKNKIKLINPWIALNYVWLVDSGFTVALKTASFSRGLVGMLGAPD